MSCSNYNEAALCHAFQMSADHSALSIDPWVVNLRGFLMYKQPLQKENLATLS